MRIASEPESRIMAIAPVPGGVDSAMMVSVYDMVQNYKLALCGATH